MLERTIPLSLLASICLLWSGTASAAPDASKVESTRRESAAPSGGDRSGGASTTNLDTPVIEPDTLENRLGTREGQRSWSIAASLETHVAFVQTEPDDLRTAPGKLYNYFLLSPQVFVSEYDQIRVDAGIYQYFTADQGEDGFRFADVAARYTRYIPILTGDTHKRPSAPPSKGVLLRAEVSATAPTSLVSQERGLITVPRLRLYLERTFLNDSLLLGINGFGEYYIDRYRTTQGGDSNAITRYSAQVSADYVMPFEKRLSVGALFASSWTYFYEPDSTILPYPGGVSTPPHQPPQQDYSAEADVLFAFPTWKGIRATAALTYSLGDNTVLHDGVQHLYFAFYRRTSEMYATLTARY